MYFQVSTVSLEMSSLQILEESTLKRYFEIHLYYFRQKLKTKVHYFGTENLLLALKNEQMVGLREQGSIWVS